MTTAIDLLARALPFVEECHKDPTYKKGVVAKLAREMRALVENSPDEPEGYDVPSLMELFPTLQPLAAKARKEKWDGPELVNQSRNRYLGSGGTFAADFISAGTFGGLFTVRDALAKWDSEHRAGWIEATRRLAKSW